MSSSLVPATPDEVDLLRPAAGLIHYPVGTAVMWTPYQLPDHLIVLPVLTAGSDPRYQRTADAADQSANLQHAQRRQHAVDRHARLLHDVVHLGGGGADGLQD